MKNLFGIWKSLMFGYEQFCWVGGNNRSSTDRVKEMTGCESIEVMNIENYAYKFCCDMEKHNGRS